jgi:hypothetical protein
MKACGNSIRPDTKYRSSHHVHPPSRREASRSPVNGKKTLRIRTNALYPASLEAASCPPEKKKAPRTPKICLAQTRISVHHDVPTYLLRLNGSGVIARRLVSAVSRMWVAEDESNQLSRAGHEALGLVQERAVWRGRLKGSVVG